MEYVICANSLDNFSADLGFLKDSLPGMLEMLSDE
jgi:hypothetical protein